MIEIVFLIVNVEVILPEEQSYDSGVSFSLQCPDMRPVDIEDIQDLDGPCSTTYGEPCVFPFVYNG